MNRQWVKEMILYLSKVYDLKKMVKSANDGRSKKIISSSTLFSVILFGFLFRISSMEELDRMIKKGQFKKLIPRKEKIGSHDTVRRSLQVWDLEHLHSCNKDIVHKTKRNKVFAKGSIDGLRVAAIDGMEFFSSTSRCCSGCLERTPRDKTEKEYFHRAVVMQMIGKDPRLFLEMEPIKKQDGSDKSEGEIAAVRRMIQKVYRKFKRVFDVLRRTR